MSVDTKGLSRKEHVLNALESGRELDLEEMSWARDLLSAAEHDRLWVNDERTVLARLWRTGTVEVATRDEPGSTWGPPVYLTEEK